MFGIEAWAALSRFQLLSQCRNPVLHVSGFISSSTFSPKLWPLSPTYSQVLHLRTNQSSSQKCSSSQSMAANCEERPAVKAFRHLIGLHRSMLMGLCGSYELIPVFSVTNILPFKEFIRLHFYYIHEAGRSAAALERWRWLCWWKQQQCPSPLLIPQHPSPDIHESNVSLLSIFLWCNVSGQKCLVCFTASCRGGGENPLSYYKVQIEWFNDTYCQIHPRENK